MNKQRSQPPHTAAASQAERESGLSLEDTGAQRSRAPAKGVTADKGRPAGSYNPYDVSPHELAAAARAAQVEPRSKPKDLRKLSEWIRLRRQVDALKKDE